MSAAIRKTAVQKEEHTLLHLKERFLHAAVNAILISVLNVSNQATKSVINNDMLYLIDKLNSQTTVFVALSKSNAPNNYIKTVKNVRIEQS